MLTLKLDYIEPFEVDQVADNPVVSLDMRGAVLSRFVDDEWVFPESQSRPNCRRRVRWPPNAQDAKQLAFLRLTNGDALGSETASKMSMTLARLASFCNRKKIEIRQLHRHPHVVIDFCSETAPGKDKPNGHRIQMVSSIAKIASALRDSLGWCFLEHNQIEALARIETLEKTQYAVIPIRIHREIDDAAHRIITGYLEIADQLDEVLSVWAHASNRQRRGKAHWGTLISARPRLEAQFQKYAPNAQVRTSAYFTTVRAAAFWIIAAGTCARLAEILDLREGCLSHEQIAENLTTLITGATTKTQDNHHAIWVASPRVEPAVRALERMLATYKTHHPNPPNLTDRLFQVMEMTFGRKLSPSQTRRGKLTFGDAIRHAYLEKLLSHSNVTITLADWQEAKQLTPNIDEQKFGVGKKWRFSAHQIRRSVLVRAAASGLVSQDSLSFQAKHQTWQMTAYYCRNYWHFSGSMPDHPLVLGTRESDAAEFTRIFADSYNEARETVRSDPQYFSPYGENHKRQIVEATPLFSLDDITRLEKSGGLKRNTLGLCAQLDYCPWQSAITVRGCMTRSEGEPCSKAVIDSGRLPELRALGDSVRYDLEALPLRNTFAREQKQADLVAIEDAISLIEQYRSANDDKG